MVARNGSAIDYTYIRYYGLIKQLALHIVHFMTSSSSSDEIPDILDLLQRICTQLEQLNVSIDRIATTQQESVDRTISAVPVANVRVPASSSTANRRTDSPSNSSIDRDAHLELEDEAIITHRYRGQYGKIGTVVRVAHQFVWIRTPTGEEYQKRRDKVAKYIGHRR